MKNRLIINYLLPVALNVLVPYSPEENVTEDGTNKTDPLAQFRSYVTVLIRVSSITSNT